MWCVKSRRKRKKRPRLKQPKSEASTHMNHMNITTKPFICNVRQFIVCSIWAIFLFQSATCKFCTQNEQTVKRHHESWKSLTKTVHQKPNHHVFHFSSTSRIHLNRSITCNYIVYRSSLYYAKTNDCGLGTRSCHYTVDSDLLYLNGSQRTQYALRRRLISFLSISMWEAQPFLYLSISGSPSPISCQKHTQFVTAIFHLSLCQSIFGVCARSPL